MDRRLNNDRSKSPGCGLLFFGLFMAIGLAAFTYTVLIPLYKTHQSESWEKVPCTILSSDLSSKQSSNNSRTYAIEVAFSYVYQGQEYTSDRYNFINYRTNVGRKEKDLIVQNLPKGLETTCLVNPANPSEAILNNAITSDVWLSFLTLIFVVIGLGGMIFTIRSSRPSRSQTERNMPSDTQPATFAQPARPVSGWYPLKPKHGPVKKFVGILIFTLIWNGIVAIPCYKIVQGFQSGKPDWFLTLFIGGLFVPFGLLFLAISFHQFLAMFNPRVELEVTDLVLKPGGTLSIRWKTRGWVKVIRTLGFVLEGVETTYSKDASGKTRIRRGKPFAQLASPVFERTTDLSRGQCEIIIPEDAKPTVLEGDQKIEWQLKTCGDIAFWPDISDEYEVRVEGAKVR